MSELTFFTLVVVVATVVAVVVVAADGGVVRYRRLKRVSITTATILHRCSCSPHFVFYYFDFKK